MGPTRTVAPAMPISITPPPVPASSSGASSRSTWPLAMALRRHPNICEGDIPYRRATAETFTSGASASSAIRALVSSGQLRRPAAGLLSIRPGTTSSNWKLLSLGICADIGTHTVIKTTVPIPQSPSSGQTGSPWRLRSASGSMKCTYAPLATVAELEPALGLAHTHAVQARCVLAAAKRSGELAVPVVLQGFIGETPHQQRGQYGCQSRSHQHLEQQ